MSLTMLLGGQALTVEDVETTGKSTRLRINNYVS